MTAPYDGLPESWEPYTPTPEPEREHVEIRTLGSDRCLCPQHVEQYERERRAEQARKALPAHPTPDLDLLLLDQLMTPSYADLVHRVVTEQAARIRADADRMLPRNGSDHGTPARNAPKPRKPPGDDRRAGLPVPPIWHDDGTLTVWHPSSPGSRVTVPPGLLRRLLHACGLSTSPFATIGELARSRRGYALRRRPPAQPVYDGIRHTAVCHQCDDRAVSIPRTHLDLWVQGHRATTGHTRITVAPTPPSGPGGGSPRIPTTRGRR